MFTSWHGPGLTIPLNKKTTTNKHCFIWNFWYFSIEYTTHWVWVYLRTLNPIIGIEQTSCESYKDKSFVVRMVWKYSSVWNRPWKHDIWWEMRLYRRVELNYCGLVTPCGHTDLGQHWIGWWLVPWRHQVITWTNVDLLSMGICDTRLRLISHDVLKISIRNMSLKIHLHYYLHVCHEPMW